MKTTTSAWARRLAIGFCLAAFGLEVARAQSTNCVSPLNSDFYIRFTVAEGAEYVQTNAGGAVPDGSNYIQFIAILKLATNLSGSVSSAALTVPGQQPALMNQLGLAEFFLGAATNSFSNLSAAYPAGDYEFTYSNRTTTVPLPSGHEPPNPPTLPNFTADQSIDATKDYALKWGAFEGGLKTDLITVSLTDQTGDSAGFDSAVYGCPGQLNGTSTSLLIPANTLTNSSVYRATITFIKILTIDTNSVPGDAQLAGMETILQTTVGTAGAGGASAPLLSNAALLPGGGVRFDVATTPGLSYTVQYNQTLTNSAGWTPLLVTNAAASVVSFTNIPSAGTTAGFYRALQK